MDYALRDYPYKNYYKISGANGLGCYSRFPILSAHPVRYASLNNGSIAYKIKVNGDTLLVVNNHLESNKLTEKDKEVYREMMKDPDKQKGIARVSFADQKTGGSIGYTCRSG